MLDDPQFVIRSETLITHDLACLDLVSDPLRLADHTRLATHPLTASDLPQAIYASNKGTLRHTNTLSADTQTVLVSISCSIQQKPCVFDPLLCLLSA